MTVASTTAVEAPGDGVGSSRNDADRRVGRLAWVVLGATLLPLVVAAVRAVARGDGPDRGVGRGGDLRPGLQETWDSRTVAVFLEPISAADGT
jgi:hypothetical protein